MNETTLNDGLHLAMEWGEAWLQPIQERLRALHPGLGEKELNACDRTCRAAMTYGHRLVPLCWRPPGTVQQTAYASFTSAMREKYPWISEENLGRLYSQGMYYAWKNGDIPIQGDPAA